MKLFICFIQCLVNHVSKKYTVKLLQKLSERIILFITVSGTIRTAPESEKGGKGTVNAYNVIGNTFLFTIRL